MVYSSTRQIFREFEIDALLCLGTIINELMKKQKKVYPDTIS